MIRTQRHNGHAAYPPPPNPFQSRSKILQQREGAPVKALKQACLVIAIGAVLVSLLSYAVPPAPTVSSSVSAPRLTGLRKGGGVRSQGKVRNVKKPEEMKQNSSHHHHHHHWDADTLEQPENHAEDAEYVESDESSDSSKEELAAKIESKANEQNDVAADGAFGRKQDEELPFVDKDVAQPVSKDDATVKVVVIDPKGIDAAIDEVKQEANHDTNEKTEKVAERAKDDSNEKSEESDMTDSAGNADSEEANISKEEEDDRDSGEHSENRDSKAATELASDNEDASIAQVSRRKAKVKEDVTRKQLVRPVGAVNSARENDQEALLHQGDASKRTARQKDDEKMEVKVVDPVSERRKLLPVVVRTLRVDVDEARDDQSNPIVTSHVTQGVEHSGLPLQATSQIDQEAF